MPMQPTESPPPRPLQELPDAVSQDDIQQTQGMKVAVGMAAFTVWVLGMAVSYAGSQRIEQEAQARAQSQFEIEAQSMENAIRTRFNAIAPALKGIRSTYEATNSRLSRLTFRRWVASRDVSIDVPGVRGLGFIERVPRHDLDEFIARERADSAPDFRVRTSGNARDLLVIKFIEPLANNTQAWGYDVGSEPIRRAAAERAIDSGLATLTGAITLVQDGNKRPGFLLYVPVYHSGAAKSTAAERRSALAGLAYSPIVVEELLADALKPFKEQLHVDIHDHDSGPLIFGQDETADAARANSLSKAIQIEVGQRLLLAHIQTTPKFEAAHESRIHLWFGAIGAMLSTLAAFTLWMVGMARARAEQMVKQRTHDLAVAKAQSESTLRENQALFDALNQFGLVSVADRNGVIQQVNDGLCVRSGYSREELVGRQHNILDSGHHPAAFWQEMWQTISSGRPWQGDICNRTKSGQTFWCNCLIAPHLDAHGQVQRYVALRLDISQAKSLERERAELNERLALAIDGGNDGLWDWRDVNSDHVWWSPQFYRLLGLPVGDGSSSWSTLEAALHPDDLAHTRQAIEATLSTGEAFDVEFRMLTRGEHHRWFRTRAKVYRDTEGKVCRMAGSLQDIHERRLAEFELADRVAQMKAIFSLTADGFVAFDEEGQVSYVSPAFEKLTGIPLHIAMEANEQTLFRVLVSQAFGETAATCFAELPRTMDIRPPAACKIALQWHEGHGAVSKMLHLRDVTQEVELDQMKSTFMSMAAHELRTPMASIYGFTELLLTREFKPAKQRDLLERIMRQSESMIDIINELLDLSRLEAKLGRDFQFEQVNLQELVETVITDYKVPNGREAPRLKVDDAQLCVLVDQGATRQTILNVLSNAYKYSPAGGEVTIELPTPDVDMDMRAVVIRDRGIGMTPEQLARVGERFFRAD
ncbi:MAG: hypothetical protein RI907_775, partial [Pseudomonadota bacterium]